MILLTGATGATGSRVLRRLLDRGDDVRCLVRDPMRLGPRRIAVGLAHWTLTDRRLPRSAMRDVSTLVHVAGPLHDQTPASLEELTITSTWRLVDAAARAGVGHVVVVSALGAGVAADCRFLRAKRLMEDVALGAGVPVTIVAPSLILSPGDRWTWTARALAALPVSPIPSGDRGRSAPVAADDVAAAIAAAVDAGPPTPPGGAGAGSAGNGSGVPADREGAPAAPSDPAGGVPTGDAADVDADRARGAAHGAVRRIEAAGPHALTVRELVRALQEAQGRRRRAVPMPAGVLRLAAAALERPGVVDREELSILRCDTAGRRGTADLTALGIRPRTLTEALAG